MLLSIQWQNGMCNHRPTKINKTISLNSIHIVDLNSRDLFALIVTALSNMRCHHKEFTTETQNGHDALMDRGI